MKKILSLFVILLFIVACGSSDSGDSGGGTSGITIIIDNNTFSTTSFSASPGETITVINDDNVSHTVTSESAPNAFDDDGDFDTGTLAPGLTTTFQIPSDASVGDTIFFYCIIHEGTMTVANGTITII